MTFLTNSLYGQKRPFRKENESFSFKTSLNSPKSVSKKINCESPENTEIVPITKITEITTESRDLVISKREVAPTKDVSIPDSNNSIKQVYESLGKRLEQENSIQETKIKNLLDLLETSKSEISKLNLDYTSFKSQKAIENSTDFKVLHSFLRDLKDFSESQFSQGYVKEIEDISRKIHRNELVLAKFTRKFKEISQRNSRILKELKKVTEKLDIADRKCKNLKQELEFQENCNQKIQLSLENSYTSKEKEIGKIREQLEISEREFKFEKGMLPLPYHFICAVFAFVS
jgi:hypothetical protein